MNVTDEFNNEDRANAALDALAAHSCLLPDAIRWRVDSSFRENGYPLALNETLTFFEGLQPIEKHEVLETAIRDLLTNVHHLADMAGLDWDDLETDARNLHAEEVEHEREHEPDTYRGILVDQGYGESTPRSVAPAGYYWVPVQRDNNDPLYEFDEQAATAYAAAISSPMPVCWGEPDFEGAALDVFVCVSGADDQRWVEDITETDDNNNQKEN